MLAPTRRLKAISEWLQAIPFYNSLSNPSLRKGTWEQKDYPRLLIREVSAGGSNLTRAIQAGPFFSSRAPYVTSPGSKAALLAVTSHACPRAHSLLHLSGPRARGGLWKDMRVDKSDWRPPSDGHSPPPSPNSVEDCRKWFVRLEVISALGPF